MAEGKPGSRGRTNFIAICVTVGGVAMLGLSRALTGSDMAEWLSGALVNAGTAVLLFVPLYLVTRSLDRHVERVRSEAVEGVETLTARVADFEADIDRRLEEVAQTVTSRLAAERTADAEAFDALTVRPTRADVLRALAVGHRQGLISAPPRVLVNAGRGLYVAFEYAGEDENVVSETDDLTLLIQGLEGTFLDCAVWSANDSVEDVMFRLGRQLEARSHPRDDFDVAALFSGLADLLRVAASSPERRPLRQLCPPQWAVREGGVVSYGQGTPLYSVRVERLRREQGWSRHMADKPWVDIESFEDAYEAALALFPEQDEPPF